ncbi:MAG: hypothetical protein D6757_03540 [Alphaproteobacteria bacterium]|nr:MAG: hypothetical protein D6757_03540 [Alphaproteobacteria bacterium]
MEGPPAKMKRARVKRKTMANMTAIDTGRSEGDERPLFGGMLADDQSREAVAQAADILGLNTGALGEGGIANAVRRFALTAAPRVLVVDLAESNDPGADLQALADVCPPDTLVVAIGTINDVRFYRSLIAAGIHDYLVKPIDPESLLESLRQALALLSESDTGEEAVGQAGRSSCRTLLCCGVRGGVGTSLVAQSIAHLLAERQGAAKDGRVALVDLDFHFGTAALAFDLEAGRGLVDALANPQRIDPLFLERAALKVHERLHLFSAEAPLRESVGEEPQALNALMEVIAAGYSHLVLDVPRHFLTGPLIADLLERVDDVLLIADPTLASVRDTIRIAARLKELGISAAGGESGRRSVDSASSTSSTSGGQLAASCHLWLNRVPSAALQEVRTRDFANSAEQRVAAELPFDPKAALAAARAVRPVPAAAPRSSLARALRRAFAALAGTRENATQGGNLFGRLLKRGER